MKIVDSWLREWVDPDIETDDLAHQLTMLGLEVDEITLEGEGLDGVVVGEVVDVKKHPDADRLSVCEVSTGGEETVAVVCGAPNVEKGMKSPLAVPGVRLPNGLKLRKTKIRGVPSNGMLCSAVELGLGEEADGILRLPEPQLDRTLAVITLADAQSFFVYGDRVSEVAVLAEDSDAVSSMLAELRGTVERAAPQPVEVHPWNEVMPELEQFIFIDDAGMYIMLAILVVIVAFGILNTILMSVLERQRELGVMLAWTVVPFVVALKIFRWG